jgi:hypothetical protein
MQWTSAYVVMFHVITFSNSIAGNPMICGVNSGDNCSSVSLDPLSYPPDDLKSEFFYPFHYSVAGYTLPVKKNLMIVFLRLSSHMSPFLQICPNKA